MGIFINNFLQYLLYNLSATFSERGFFANFPIVMHCKNELKDVKIDLCDNTSEISIN